VNLRSTGVFKERAEKAKQIAKLTGKDDQMVRHYDMQEGQEVFHRA
jgi:hypothetical protein